MNFSPFIEPVLDPAAQTAIIAVLLMIFLDFAVGLGGAVLSHNYSSVKMREGLLHKYMELCSVALGIILDGTLTSGLDISIQPILLAACSYIIVMETGSVLELIKTYNPDAEGLVGWLTSFVNKKED